MRGGIVKFPLRIVYIEWVDAVSHARWQDTDELKEWADAVEGFVNRELGFLIEQDEKRVLLAGAWAPDTPYNDEMWSNLTKIPCAWIRKLRVLGTVNKAGEPTFALARRARKRRKKRNAVNS